MIRAHAAVADPADEAVYETVLSPLLEHAGSVYTGGLWKGIKSEARGDQRVGVNWRMISTATHSNPLWGLFQEADTQRFAANVKRTP